jgi:hypothetical protein
MNTKIPPLVKKLIFIGKISNNIRRGDNVDKNKLKLTSSEIGTLWGQYVNGTMKDVVNRYMYSISLNRCSILESGVTE